MTESIVAAAQRWTRVEFAANYTHFFLVGEPSLQAPRAPMRTMSAFAPALRSQETIVPGVDEATSTTPARLVVLAVRKRQDMFPEMITVGRTGNNDLVVPDATVSKFHAFFKQTGERLDLVDAASRNGTRVNGKAIGAKQPAAVTAGARIRFGGVDFVLCSAAEAWDAIRIRP
ncbi:MAG: FHA domain-containing protein [Deltaproteobacteria bacterium]|nr:FHA domain-containing protein [Deltaproteobacteria bacterium]